MDKPKVRSSSFKALLVWWLIVGVAVAFAAVAVAAEPAAAAGLNCNVQAARLKLCGARTDNYKDCYNADFPGAAETRTWLAWHTLRIGTASYRYRAGQNQFPRRLLVSKVSGPSTFPRNGYIALATSDTTNVAFSSFRIGPPAALWGVFLQVRDRNALAAAPIKFVVTLRNSGGARIARSFIDYRYDQALSDADSSSPEYNGPGGRWYVGTRAAATDVELGTPANCP